MPRILKRPMFSRGGSTNKNDGIMTGLVDRKGFENGTEEPLTQAEIYAKEYYDQLSKIQPPKSRLNLGKVGLNLAAGKYSGGDLISSLAGAGSDIYDDYTAKDDVRRNLDYKTKMASAKMGISKADAEAIALAKAKADRAKNLAKVKKGYKTLSSEEAKNELGQGFNPSKTYQKNLDTKQISQITGTGNTGETKTKLMKELEAAGFAKGSPEYEAAIKSFIFKESKTTAERNAAALELIPGTDAYNQYIKDATYITNAAMERDIQSTGVVIGKAARDKILADQSFVTTVRGELDEVTKMITEDNTLAGSSGSIRRFTNKLVTAIEDFGPDLRPFMPKDFEDKVYSTDIAKLSALEAALAPAYARVLFPRNRMTNFLILEAKNRMNLTGLTGSAEVLARLEEITGKFDTYIKNNEMLLGNENMKRFKTVIDENGKATLVEIK